ncbi:hypothetical protein [Bradyrhizobium liaoningense]|uniref:hypothetical protein n=1 Tax=Bradyrhizobium liaoningense TaxID=43992 RepID=UPI001BACB133|nr:hypothetical protein [Bradyrhizobium liaoningense]MBR0904596.1 hypothetical protein [Bradyrhizobium liaoningense]
MMDQARRFREGKSQPDTHSRILLHRAPRLAGQVGEVLKNAKPDRRLTDRIITSFRQGMPQSGNSIWLNEFAQDKKVCVEILMSGKVAAAEALLTDPASSMLFYGFDNIHSRGVSHNKEAWWQNWMHGLAYDSLLQLAKAVGCIRVENPEPGVHPDESPDPEFLLNLLDRVFGFYIDFPNLYRGELGLLTSRGVASYRAVQALYQAWRIATLAPNGRICEIGGGLGRTAYYAMKMGMKTYSIVDLPLTGVSQAYFLGRLMTISLEGERQEPVHLMPPEAYGIECDLVANFDSLTEMDQSSATAYLANAKARTFLSINHEANAFTVRDLTAGRRVHRSPCWLREGYVEELIQL